MRLARTACCLCRCFCSLADSVKVCFLAKGTLVPRTTGTSASTTSEILTDMSTLALAEGSSFPNLSEYGFEGVGVAAGVTAIGV